MTLRLLLLYLSLPLDGKGRHSVIHVVNVLITNASLTVALVRHRPFRTSRDWERVRADAVAENGLADDLYA